MSPTLDNDLELTNTGVFAAIGVPHLPPGPLMVAEAAASAHMLEHDRDITEARRREWREQARDLDESVCGASDGSVDWEAA